ncbi:MAG: putative diheme cytochrome c-553 [Myxococcaceae bacterium]|nr:putative diheme cytochrome c-553 [Myxococcaceae bacterium]
MNQAENTRALAARRGAGSKHAGRRASKHWKSACTAAALILAVGCGDDGSSGGTTTPVNDSGMHTVTNDAGTPLPTKDAGKGDASTTTPTETGDVAHGKTIALVCTACHGSNLAGATYYPNITPDKTNGVGSWTDDELANAFNNGKDQDGSMLCSEMMPYNFDESDTADLLAYLRSIPANAKKITGECPGN